ncbi:MAG TPA: biotin carboxylase N-terminal domain-containing protein [Candidatus Limnocylindrales bacterium]
MSEELSPSQAAARLGATTRSVQRWIAAGRLPARRIGGRWRVASDVLDAFVRRGGPVAGDAAVAGPPIRRIFVANRGEIAARITRTCDALGIVAIVPPTDEPGGLDLLDIRRVIAAAVESGANAVHPGFGFLAESADFAAAVGVAGLRWIGPPPGAIRSMGDKAAARRLAHDLGIPTVAGYDADAQDDATLTRAARRIGYPILVKPAAGGGGKGMHTVAAPADLPSALAAARREAAAAFGDDRVILERQIEGAHHVEVQLLFDSHGEGVHLGERECSIQRRHQKVLEETPSPAVRGATRRRLMDAALAIGRAIGYVSAGTCEFLLDDRGDIHFLEMNTRLQVEHPVTELVTGRDLVADQIRIAAGEPLGFRQSDVRPRGHAIEVRLYAEDPEAGFLPATGRVAALRWPSGDGIRIDAGIAEGHEITDRFDPMLAKIVACGGDRREALARLTAALDETVVLGVTTNLRFLRWLVRQSAVVRGQARIDTLDRTWDPAAHAITVPDEAWARAARLLGSAGWRLNGPAMTRLVADAGEDGSRTVAVDADEGTAADPSAPVRAAVRDGDVVHVDVEGRSVAFRIAPPPDVDRAAEAAAAHARGSGGAELLAPMPGSVIAVHRSIGDAVAAGDPVVTLEAMKMEHVVAAPVAGSVATIGVRAGDQVTRGQRLGSIEA